ncbi:MAG: N-acetyltransferase [Pirellulaceae bacterium]|nr:N-acetyltransferase [Pirellulaceae bacterium]
MTSETLHPHQLFADELKESDRKDLIDFSCGDETWSRAATEWLIGSEVWRSIEERKTKVWLYRTADGQLIGFGSLGVTRRRWPPPEGGYANLLIIPMIGIDVRYHGQPSDKNWRYSHQVISHLRYESILAWNEHVENKKSILPLLLLYVHRDNHKAIRLYEKFGFDGVQAASNDLILMAQKLSDELAL